MFHFIADNCAYRDIQRQRLQNESHGQDCYAFNYCMQFVFDVCRTHGVNPVAQSMDVVVVSVRCVGVNQIRQVEPVEQ